MSTARLATLSAVALAACMLANVPADAQSYAKRTVRLVVGFGAGGPTDIPARFIANKLSSAIGQRVVVENKPGASGMIATRDVLSQPPDGYHLLLCTHFESINTVLYKKVGFKLSDLAPISQISLYYYGLALANSIPATTFEEFVDYAKAHPNKISYATIGAGSAQEIFARQLERLAGISMNRIPFRTGPQVLQELVPGRVHFYVSPTLSVIPLHEQKQLKILATSSPERLKTTAQVPTLREKGIDFVRFGWLGVCARAGTPAPIVSELNRHIAAIVASPEYRQLIERAGSVPVSSTPEGLGKILTQTVDDVAATIREFGMQQE